MAKLLRDIDSKTKSNYFDGSDESRNRDCTSGDFSGTIIFGLTDNQADDPTYYFACDKPGNYPSQEFYRCRLQDEGTLCRQWGQ